MKKLIIFNFDVLFWDTKYHPGYFLRDAGHETLELVSKYHNVIIISSLTDLNDHLNRYKLTEYKSIITNNICEEINNMKEENIIYYCNENNLDNLEKLHDNITVIKIDRVSLSLFKEELIKKNGLEEMKYFIYGFLHENKTIYVTFYDKYEDIEESIQNEYDYLLLDSQYIDYIEQISFDYSGYTFGPFKGLSYLKECLGLYDGIDSFRHDGCFYFTDITNKEFIKDLCNNLNTDKENLPDNLKEAYNKGISINSFLHPKLHKKLS